MSSQMKAHALLLRIFADDPVLHRGLPAGSYNKQTTSGLHAETSDVIHALLYSET